MSFFFSLDPDPGAFPWCQANCKIMETQKASESKGRGASLFQVYLNSVFSVQSLALLLDNIDYERFQTQDSAPLPRCMLQGRLVRL